METRLARTIYEFGEFRLDPVKRLLLREGEPVSVLPKALEMLVVLLENQGRLLEKDELMNLLWPDTIVEEANLSVTMSALRKALGETAQEHRFIVTVPRRGYRFVAEVSKLAEDDADLIVEQHEVARFVVEQELVSDSVPIMESAASQKTLPGIRPKVFSRFHLVIGLAAAILISVLVYFLVNRTSESPAVRSIAVLPFKPLVADSQDEYLQMGMADVLITRLSNLRPLIVRPTSAIRRFTDPNQDAATIGRDLKVDAVLDGNIQRVNDRVRITARLVSINNGETLWAETFDEKFTDIFRVQDQLSEKLANSLTLKLSPGDRQRLAKRHTENPEAFQAYSKGRFFWAKWNRDGLKKSVEYFQQAIAADPEYALAHCGLADAYNLQGYLNFEPPREAFPKCEAAARQALKLDNTLGEAHLILSKIKLFYDWDWPGFEQELNRAHELNPNLPDIHGMRATYLTAMGRFDEAIAERKLALGFDPLSPLITTTVGWPYFYAHRYDEAIAWYQRALELDPNFAQAHNDIGLCSSMLGKNDVAINEWLIGRSLTGADAATVEMLRQAYAAGGMKGYRQMELELTLERAKQQRVRSWLVAGIYHGLGDREQTFAWLEKAFAERDGLMPFLKVMPQYEDLRNDPRFADLLRRVGLTQ